MPSPKLSFDEALERINELLPMSAADVRADALRRVVWVYEWHLPGCMSESSGIALTKRDAIAAALAMAAGAEGPPRGMRADLQRHGRSARSAPDAWAHGAITTIKRCTLSSLL